MKNILCLLCVVFLFGFGAPQLWAQRIVCIDAGHGGSDPGAVGCGLEEKNINLAVANRLATALKNAGVRVYLTRSGDQTVSLASRVNYANSVGAHRFVSIHCNAFNQAAHGTETFCYTQGSSTSFNMRNRVNPKVVQALNTYDRGCKTANFYVLKYTNMPAILCELAFIDNPGDAAKLRDPYYQQRAAEAIMRGVQECLAIETDLTTGSGSYMAPRWSPDGSQILMSGAGYQGIYVCPVEGGDVTELTNEAMAGYRAQWISDTEVCYSDADGDFIVSTTGVKTRSIRPSDEISALVEEELLKGAFYNACISPDQKKVVFEGLNGLYVYDITREISIPILESGGANNPCWAADGKYLFFDRTWDNGHEIIGGDIWMLNLVNLDDPRIANLTSDCELIAQRPSVSPNGAYLAFDAEGKIFIAKLNGEILEEVRQLEKK